MSAHARHDSVDAKGTGTLRLSNADFRFLSAWVQGVEVERAWELYMAHRGTSDLRRIRSSVRAMLDQLAGIARRHGDATTAALLRRDPTRLRPSRPDALRPSSTLAAPAAVPTLEEFAAGFEPDFFSQAELLELWAERFGRQAGASGRGRESPELRLAKRRARLVERQLEALRRLEALAGTSPQPQDPVEAWLSQTTAQRLRAVGIRQLGELMYWIRAHGYRWYARVPRIGEEGAGRLVRWLGQHEDSLGAVPLTALAPRQQLPLDRLTPAPKAGVVPIERLAVPATLSGAEGDNRAPIERCRIRARNDYEAVCAYIALFAPDGDQGNAHTWRAYRKEAERFLLWALFERGMPLSSLDAQDCLAYRKFLANPGPAWIGTKSAQRWSEQWRPFEGPLSVRSRATAETIVKAMCGWLVDVRYLDSNPWLRVPRSNTAPPMPELRSLSDPQWTFVDQWLSTLADTPANRRLRIMFELALRSGMREAELAGARVKWLRPDMAEDGGRAWNLMVLGKRQRWREIPLPARFAVELVDYLRYKGLGDEIEDMDPEAPLLSALNDAMRPMAPARVYELMKDAFERCAQAVARTDSQSAQRIRRASPHWMRHTHGRKFVEGGGSRRVLQEQLGHASEATTAIYDRSSVNWRRRDIEKVFGQ